VVEPACVCAPAVVLVAVGVVEAVGFFARAEAAPATLRARITAGFWDGTADETESDPPPPMNLIAPPKASASRRPSRATIRIGALTDRATVVLLSAIAGDRFTRGWAEKREGAVSRALSRQR